MLSFLYVYSDHSILECYNLFSGVELSMRSFFVIYDSVVVNYVETLQKIFPEVTNLKIVSENSITVFANVSFNQRAISPGICEYQKIGLEYCHQSTTKKPLFVGKMVTLRC